MMIPGLREEKENPLHSLSLKELENRVFEITKKQTYITHWGLRKETIDSVINELQEQKKSLLDLMHKKIDKL